MGSHFSIAVVSLRSTARPKRSAGAALRRMAHGMAPFTAMPPVDDGEVAHAQCLALHDHGPYACRIPMASNVV